ncbi:MAG: hypothetical protein K2J76_01245 [Oscillospiraceae bacterium]|nr:hypothetical protein [Oscillospiraceae bacterium]
MKEAVYKFFTAGLTVLIFFGILHSMSLLSNLNDYNYTKRAAEKNAGLAAAGDEIPVATVKAPAEAMRTEPAPITAEDLSYIYIDGIKIDFPCTLADIQEHFETRRFAGGYDEEKAKYSCTEILMKNGMGFYRIGYTADTRKPSPEECTVNSISTTGAFDNYGKYFPQYVAAGMDIVNTTDEEFFHLAALYENEYLTTNLIICPHGNDGYTAFNFEQKRIAYYRKDDPEDMKTIEKLNPVLIKTELRLPEDYDIENVPESKEALREFALEYYEYDENDTSLFSNNGYCKEVEIMVNDIYLTAYEFLAVASDEYNAFYYELTDIEALTTYNSESDNPYIRDDTEYLKVTANCYIEGYDEPAKTDMILKVGDKLGDALLIQIDV